MKDTYIIIVTYLQFVFIIVGNDGYTQVAILTKQWSSLQLSAHGDIWLFFLQLLSSDVEDSLKLMQASDKIMDCEFD